MKPFQGVRTTWLVAVLITGPVFQTPVAIANLSGSDPSYTRAPGENSCTSCHVQTTRSGSVTLTGHPANYSPGTTYGLTVTVNTTGSRFGFQVTSLDSLGRQAGNLVSTAPSTQIKNGIVSGNIRQYIGHTSAGNSVSSWTFNWTAPNPVVGTIQFYVSGLRANNDVNTAGDTTYNVTNSSAAPLPPANNNFANREVLSGISANRTNTTVAATKEANEPSHALNRGGASVWYRWTAPSNGVVLLDTKGSLFDTLLAVYTGNSVSNLVEIASDDQSGGSNTSALTFPAFAGTNYQIAIDGYFGESGTYALHLNFLPAPANDDFFNAHILVGDSVTRSNATLGATKQPGEPNHSANAGGASVWHRWTALSNGVVLLDTKGSLFDTLLAVYTGNAVSNLVGIASDDQSGGSNTSALSFSALAGANYQIAIDGANGARGAYFLNLNFLPPPRITITGNSPNLVSIFWPTSPPGFLLEFVPSLPSSDNWMAVTNPVTQSGTQNLVMPSVSSNRFFRLRRP